jgi:hypothetical protein
VLARQVFYHFSQVPSLFVLLIFEIGSHFMPRLIQITIVLFVLPCIARMTSVYHHTQSLVEMESPKLFAQAGLKLQFCLQVAKITGLSHHAGP